MDLKDFHYLSSLRGMKHIFLTFNWPIFPARLTQMSKFLWDIRGIKIVRVFKDEVVRDLLFGKMINGPGNDLQIRSFKHCAPGAINLPAIPRTSYLNPYWLKKLNPMNPLTQFKFNINYKLNKMLH